MVIQGMSYSYEPFKPKTLGRTTPERPADCGETTLADDLLLVEVVVLVHVPAGGLGRVDLPHL